MDMRVVAFVLSKLLLAEAVILLLPLGLSLAARDGMTWVFSVAAMLTGLVAFGCKTYGHTHAASLTMREGIAITGLGWLRAVSMGMTPYLLGGWLGPLDAVFESISGFTGTGATVMTGLDFLPPSLLFWRMMTNWFGGLGIIVIFIAILPQTGQSTVYMYNAETTGPSKDRVLPRLREMTRILFSMYVCFTAIAAVVFLLCGMSPLIAVMHAMSAISTCGFSTFDSSAMNFDNWPLETCMTLFMIFGGGNFGLYYRVWHKGLWVLRQNTEFRAYLGIELGAMLLIAANLIFALDMTPSEAWRYASFQVSSISTTAGFVSADYERWPIFSQAILLLLMFGGGCAGSTAGGMKIARIVLLFKQAWRIVHQKLRPQRILTVHMDGQCVDDETLLRVGEFFFLYMVFIVFFALLYTWDGLEVFDAIGVSVSAIGNVGPAFGIAGATQNFAALPDFTKFALCFEMLMGRLEIFTFIALLRPAFWRRRSGW